MRVQLERNWMHDGYDIWFFDRIGADRTIVWFRDGLGWSQREVDAFEERGEPSLSLRSEMLELLLQAAEQVIPASHATERHLKDAIGVRDRLLVLIEADDR